MAMAHGDPDEFVRASAFRYLARVASADDAALQDLIASAMRADASPAVCAAIADGLRADACEAAWVACGERLSDASAEVRENVVDAFIRRHRAGAPFPVELKTHATAEERERLRATILSAWGQAEGSSAVLGAVSTRPSPEVVNALQFFAAERQHLAAAGLEPLLLRDEPAIDAVLAKLHGGGIVQLSPRWLVEIVLRYEPHPGAWTETGAARWEAAMASLDALRPTLAASIRVSEDERGLLVRLRDRVEKGLAGRPTHWDGRARADSMRERGALRRRQGHAAVGV